MTEADRLTIEAGAPQKSLMQRAGLAVADVVTRNYSPCPVLILCGPGNNGGDGKIAGEILRQQGWQTTVATLEKFDPGLSLDGVGLVIDALFGTGFRGALTEPLANLLQRIAGAGIPVVAVDIPSGVNGLDGTADPHTLKARHTITFARKKAGHLLLPGKIFCGDIIVADIGIPDENIQKTRPFVFENAPDLWLDKFPVHSPTQHKYDRGHCVVYGGPRLTGAARLAAQAALRMGAGLVTIACPSEVFDIYSRYRADLMATPVDNPEAFEKLVSDPRINAVIIGPGSGTDENVRQMCLAALRLKKSCVIDADAITAFAAQPDVLLSKLNANCVLTPHEGEFSRLFGRPGGSKIDRALLAAKTSGAVVLLKGADTVIASPEGKAVINANASPELATAGAGDVLSGFIGGLLAQKMPVFDATCAAAWLHGACGTAIGPGLVAEDIEQTLPRVLKTMKNHL